MYDMSFLAQTIAKFASEAPLAYALVSTALATLAGLASQYLVEG